jgi:hypothetical protein
MFFSFWFKRDAGSSLRFRRDGMRAMTSVKITQSTKAAVGVLANDEVIQNFNLEQLTGPNQIPGHLDVRL